MSSLAWSCASRSQKVIEANGHTRKHAYPTYILGGKTHNGSVKRKEIRLTEHLKCTHTDTQRLVHI